MASADLRRRLERGAEVEGGGGVAGIGLEGQAIVADRRGRRLVLDQSPEVHVGAGVHRDSARSLPGTPAWRRERRRAPGRARAGTTIRCLRPATPGGESGSTLTDPGATKSITSWPSSVRHAASPSCATMVVPSTISRTWLALRPSGSWRTSWRSARCTRRRGTEASSSVRAERSSTRSWKPNRYSRRGPRWGLRIPARAMARTRAGERPKRPAVSREV